jgi:hypothetical protein
LSLAVNVNRGVEFVLARALAAHGKLFSGAFKNGVRVSRQQGQISTFHDEEPTIYHPA